MMLDAFRIRGSVADREGWGQDIEAASDRWPAHLKTALTALARELLRTGGDLTLADWDRTKRDAAGLRAAGYAAGVSLDMENATTLLAQFFSAGRRISPVRRVQATC